MIAHTTLPASDYQRSRAFYGKARAPLGYRNNMEFGDSAGFVHDPDAHNIEAVWYDHGKGG